MSFVEELYQEVILDHNRKPRNFGEIAEANRRAEGYNPLCGDRVTVTVKTADGVIRAIAFEGNGCAISTASASMMTEALKGKTIAEARRLFDHFHQLVTGTGGELPEGEEYEALAVFGGVSEYPVRVKCATLAWHTLAAALEKLEDTVSTE